MRKVRRGAIVAAVLTLVLTLFRGGDLARIFVPDGPHASPTIGMELDKPATGTYQPLDVELGDLLSHVKVVERRPSVEGYDRECGTEHACSFGPAWSDDVGVDGGRNGCDTRNDMLARSLREVQYRPGTRDCVVVVGLLDEPYTGESIEFRKEAAREVGIDHLYPLARAWDLGAASWSDQRRRDFANDPRNLLAVSGRANSSKRDLGPGEWLPINAAFRCEYVARFIAVAIAYELPITVADRDTVRTLEPRCTPPRTTSHEKKTPPVIAAEKAAQTQPGDKK